MIASLLLLACAPEPTPEQAAWDWQAPENTWDSQTPPEGTAASGWQAGDTPADFRLTDQRGDAVSLWQFYGQVIVVDVSTMWVGPLDLPADYAAGLEADYGAQGFVYVSVLAEDAQAELPEVEDLQGWAGYYGLSGPVLADDGWADGVVSGGLYPHLLLIDRGLQIAESWAGGPDEDALREAILDFL